jgi:DNA polymerase I
MKYKIRSMFIAEKNSVFVQFDFSQAEAWVVAYLANEIHMKESLYHSDIHRDTACVLFGVAPEAVTKEMRYIGKRQNHANNYGQGPERSVQVINKDSDQPPYVTVTLREAKSFREKWISYYSSIPAWWQSIEEELNVNRTLVTPYNRVRAFFGPWGKELFKEAYAYKPQSTVADHCNGKLHPELGIRGGIKAVFDDFVKPGYIRMPNQSHDSIITEIPALDAPDIIPQIHKLMARPIVVNHEQFTIPVDIEVGERWGELEKWNGDK